MIRAHIRLEWRPNYHAATMGMPSPHPYETLGRLGTPYVVAYRHLQGSMNVCEAHAPPMPDLRNTSSYSDAPPCAAARNDMRVGPIIARCELCSQDMRTVHKMWALFTRLNYKLMRLNV